MAAGDDPTRLAASDRAGGGLGGLPPDGHRGVWGWPEGPPAGASQVAGFLLVNALAVAGLYVAHGWGRVAALGETPSLGAWATFLSWATAGALALALLAVGLSAVAVRFAPRGLAPLLVGLATLVVGAVLIDTRVHGIIGVHLYSPITLEALLSPGVGRELRLGTEAVLLATAGAAILALLQAGLLKLCGRLRRRAALGLGAGVAAVLTASAAVAWLGPATASASDRRLLHALPGYELLTGPPALDRTAVTIRYPGAVPERVAFERRPDIILIQAESLRGDHVTSDLAPHVTGFAREHGCWTSPRHYSGGHTTEYGTFGLLYGLDSYHYEPFEAAKVPSWPLATLRAQGYRLWGASASALRDWKGAGFMTAQFDHYEEHLGEVDWRADVRVIQAAERLLDEPGGPKLLFLFLNATHHNYLYPPEHERFTPALAPGYDHFQSDEALREHAQAIHNRYRNAVGFVDHLFGRLSSRLADRVRRGEAVVVFTGDHGEEFWEHGLLGHAAPELVEERLAVPMMLCLPGGVQPEGVQLSSHADLWPTVFEALGARVSARAFTSGRSLLHPPRSPPLKIVGAVDFPYRYRTALVATERYKWWVELCESGGLCLSAFKATGADDHPAGVPPLSAVAGAVYQRMQRFLEFRR